MLKLTWIEFILRSIPEAFIMVWAVLSITRQTVAKEKYILCSSSLALVAYFVRFLPIRFGVNIVISTMFLVCVLVIIGIPLIKSIYGVVSTTLLLLFGEMVNIVLLSIFSINIEAAFKSPMMKCILSTPSLIVIVLSVRLIVLYMSRKEGIKDVPN
jgi:hypothetical protein